MTKRLKQLKNDLKYLEALHKVYKSNVLLANPEDQENVSATLDNLIVGGLTLGEHANVRSIKPSRKTQTLLLEATDFGVAYTRATVLPVLQRVRGQYKAEKARSKGVSVATTEVVLTETQLASDLVVAA